MRDENVCKEGKQRSWRTRSDGDLAVGGQGQDNGSQGISGDSEEEKNNTVSRW